MNKSLNILSILICIGVFMDVGKSSFLDSSSFSLNFLIASFAFIIAFIPIVMSQGLLRLRNDIFYLFLFSIFGIVSYLWTIDQKATLAKGGNIFLCTIVIYTVINIIKNSNLKTYNLARSINNTCMIILLMGLPTFDLTNREFLGGSSSLFGILFNVAAMLSLYIAKVYNKKQYYFSFLIYFLMTILMGSVRGLLAIVFSLIAFTPLFNKNPIRSYIYIFGGMALTAFISYSFLLLTDFDFLVESPIPIIHQIGRNLETVQMVLNTLDFDYLGHYSSGGLRFSLIVTGIKHTIENNYIIGAGYASSYNIFEAYGKRAYSHNGIVEIFMGLGLIGLFLYAKFFTKVIFDINNKAKGVLLQWKNSAILLYIVHLFIGKPFESIPLSILIAFAMAA